MRCRTARKADAEAEEARMSLSAIAGPAAFVGWSLIPLLGIGFTMLRYSSVDPESHPVNQRQVFQPTYNIFPSSLARARHARGLHNNESVKVASYGCLAGLWWLSYGYPSSDSGGKVVLEAMERLVDLFADAVIIICHC